MGQTNKDSKEIPTHVETFFLSSLINSKTNSHHMCENPQLRPTIWELNSTVPYYRACFMSYTNEVRKPEI